jgi:RecA-family ATPase
MTYDDGLESLDMPDADLKLTTVNALEAAALRLGIVARNGGLDKRYTKEDIDHIIRMGLNGGSSFGKLSSTTKAIGQTSGSHENAYLGKYQSRTQLPFIDMSHWDNEPVPEREWAVHGMIPLRQVTLFTGDGAVGKSLLELMRCVAHVLGKPWLGQITEPGPAIYFGAEDDDDELHRRLADILAHYEASFADVIAGGLHILSHAGEDAVLGVPNVRGIIEPTLLFKRIREAALDIQPKSITIDTVADVFAGNENDRSQTRQFVGMLRGLAIEANAALAALAHPSLEGIKSGSGLSGSTGWHNSVRARGYFTAARTEDNEEPDPTLRELVFKKNNYGPLPDKILLRWRNGVFIREPAAGSLEKLAADQKVEEMFINMLRRVDDQGRCVNDKPTAPTYAPKIFAEQPSAGASKEAFKKAMERLFAANKIRLERYGRPSRPNSKLVLVSS